MKSFLLNCVRLEQMIVSKSMLIIKCDLMTWNFRRNSVILADEMGLGKTIQTVCFLNYVFFTGKVSPTIYHCSSILKYSWNVPSDTLLPPGLFELRLTHTKHILTSSFSAIRSFLAGGSTEYNAGLGAGVSEMGSTDEHNHVHRRHEV